MLLFNDLTKRPLPRLRSASDGTTCDPSTSVYFGQTRPRLETRRAIDCKFSMGPHSPLARTLPLLHAIKRSHQTGHVDGSIRTTEPMHPRRILDLFAHLGASSPSSSERHSACLRSQSLRFRQDGDRRYTPPRQPGR